MLVIKGSVKHVGIMQLAQVYFVIVLSAVHVFISETRLSDSIQHDKFSVHITNTVLIIKANTGTKCVPGKKKKKGKKTIFMY